MFLPRAAVFFHPNAPSFSAPQKRYSWWCGQEYERQSIMINLADTDDNGTDILPESIAPVRPKRAHSSPKPVGSSARCSMLLNESDLMGRKIHWPLPQSSMLQTKMMNSVLRKSLAVAPKLHVVEEMVNSVS
jgi:hypothetical protein